MLEIGSLVDGKYKILNVVGKGGMSVVYLAMNERQINSGRLRKSEKMEYRILKWSNKILS